MIGGEQIIEQNQLLSSLCNRVQRLVTVTYRHLALEDHFLISDNRPAARAPWPHLRLPQNPCSIVHLVGALGWSELAKTARYGCTRHLSAWSGHRTIGPMEVPGQP